LWQDPGYRFAHPGYRTLLHAVQIEPRLDLAAPVACQSALTKIFRFTEILV
jgi:hypothetical protein